MSDPMEAIRQAFFEECDELLDQLEEGLLALQDGAGDGDTIGAVFRAVHSIKGGAGAFALDVLTDYAHAFENVLDQVRSGTLALDQDVVMVLLRAADVLADVARATARDEVPDAGAIAAAKAELSSLDPNGGAASAPPAAEPVFAPLALDGLDDLPDLPDPEGAPDDDGPTPALPTGAVRDWTIDFEPLPGLLTSGNEPLYFFRSLAVLGELRVSCDTTGLPGLDRLDPSDLMLRWRVHLIPTAFDLTRTEIENVFDFAEGLCHLKIVEGTPARDDTLPEPIANPAIDPTTSAPPPPSVPSPDPTAAPRPESAGAVQLGPLPQAAVVPLPPAAGTSARPVAKKPGTGVNPSEMRAKPQSTSVRVDLQRVDDLVNLVGEIVIAQAMLSQIASEPARHQELVGTLDSLNQLTLEVQDSVMAIRALPVKPLFQRMSRIVREAAQMTSKDVRLTTSGEDTQIDKTVIELLADPLTHMIRNAVDHGLEEPKTRKAAGKAATGTITLSAAQRSDRVLVEIADDGAGIDRAKVLAKAREKGLIEADTNPEPAEIDRLLFLPGFSTSDQVSELSGRGVGMDVVNRAIQDLSGTIAIQSDPGRGTKLTVSLPLTLAILDGMIVSCRGERYVLPLASIVETQILEGSKIEGVAGGGQVVLMQDHMVPMFDLGLLLGRPYVGVVEEERTVLLIEPGDGAPFALVVDGIESQRQVVVKGLGESVGRIPGVSAATILGDGQVALILDGVGLQMLARRSHAKPERLAS
ncbi:chemotaxis protein CheA [Jannaschia sp. LMIT008]|uniref:chemotaxis protein CheA n=1 Tax=Jannaschia maritima TaxID=3032585 RepID=UPI0028121DD7|nr:chemotaxis protein CheA [Jannaschia sp. LMIT008]